MTCLCIKGSEHNYLAWLPQSLDFLTVLTVLYALKHDTLAFPVDDQTKMKHYVEDYLEISFAATLTVHEVGKIIIIWKDFQLIRNVINELSLYILTLAGQYVTLIYDVDRSWQSHVLADM